MKKVNHVLLVDDSDADNFYHKFIIKETKLASRIDSEGSSIKALECWEKGCSTGNSDLYPVPDLVLLDINMPALNGFELLDKIRKVSDPRNRMKQMKIFMLTTSLNPDDYKRAKDSYSDLVVGFYIKPLTEAIFVDIVRNYFEENQP